MLQGWINKITALLFCLIMVFAAFMQQYRGQLLQQKQHLLEVIDNAQKMRQELEQYERLYDEAEENRKIIIEQTRQIELKRDLLKTVKWQFD